MQGSFNICNSINVIHHTNKPKNKNHMIISIDQKKLLTKLTTIYDKNSPESRHRGNLPQYNKSQIWQTHSKHHSQWWKTESISSEMRKQGHPLSPLLLNTVLFFVEVVATAIRDKNKTKGIRIGKIKFSWFVYTQTILKMPPGYFWSSLMYLVNLKDTKLIHGISYISIH